MRSPNQTTPSGRAWPAARHGTARADLRTVELGYPFDTEHAVVPRMAWVLTWTGSRADVHGPMTMPRSERQRIIDHARCVFDVVIAAEHAEILSTEQSCG